MNCDNIYNWAKTAYTDFTSLSAGKRAVAACAVGALVAFAPYATAACVAAGALTYGKRRFQAIEKNGLTALEYGQISEFIEKHRLMWEAMSPQGMRLRKEDTGLPRSLRIFRDRQGQLRAMVLCNQKGGVAPIGKGASNKVKRAVDYFTNTLWARRSARFNPKLLSGAALHRKLEKEPGISPAPDGLIVYLKKNETRCESYQPLWDGCLLKLDRTTLSKQQVVSMVRQSITMLMSLERHRISHTDIADRNVLYLKNSASITLGLSDFDEGLDELSEDLEDHLGVAGLIARMINFGRPQLGEKLYHALNDLFNDQYDDKEPQEILKAFDACVLKNG